MGIKEFNKCLENINKEKYFNKIYKYYFKKIHFHISYKFDKSIAEDVAEEFFTKLFTNQNLSYIENPTSWVYKVCDNIAIDYYKKQIKTEDIDFYSNALRYEEFSNYEQYEGLYKEIDGLDKLSRQVIIMYYWEGYLLKEIASCLQESYEKIKKIHSRAIKKIKGRKGGAGIER